MQTELNKFIAALQEFYAREAYILEKDLGERALTHRLAVRLERQYPGWDVDCDYNRLGERTLRLPHGTIVSTDDALGKSIYPDMSCTSARFRAICSQSNCARHPTHSRSSTTSQT